MEIYDEYEMAKKTLTRINYSALQAFKERKFLLGDINFSNNSEVKRAFRKKVRIVKGFEKLKLNLLRQYFSFDLKNTDAFEPYELEPGPNPLSLTLLIVAKETKVLENSLNKISVNKRDEVGRPCLYVASTCGYKKIVLMLLKWGSVPYFTSSSMKSTPLHGASYYGHTEIVKILLEVGADTNIKNDFGNSPYDEADKIEIQSLMDVYRKDICYNLFQNFRVYMNSVKIVVNSAAYLGKRLQILDEPEVYAWDLAWHGTKLNSLESILSIGLKKSGFVLESGLKVMNRSKSNTRLSDGHVPQTQSNDIFTSSSILYSAYRCYAEHFTDIENTEWVVILECRLRPKTYKVLGGTLKAYEPIKGEPEMLEFATDNEENVKVTAVWFLKLEFLKGFMNYADLSTFLSEYYSDEEGNLKAISSKPDAKSEKHIYKGELAFFNDLCENFKDILQSIQRVDRLFDNRFNDVNLAFFGGRFLIKNINKEELLTWDLAWHGTKLKNTKSIVEHGLLKPGEKTKDGFCVKIRNGSKARIQGSSTVQNIKGWGTAIFTSPSVKYASDDAYAQEFSNWKCKSEWLLVFECRLKPESYFQGDHTFSHYKFIKNEPIKLDFRSEKSEDVKVIALWLIKREFLEKQTDYKELTSILETYIEY